MQFLDRTLPTPEANLALDEALLLEAEAGQGGEVLRVWEWPAPAVVLGAACRLVEDVDVAACRRDRVPVLRRASGGGTVLLNEGCLCFSLVLAYARHPALGEIPSSYRWILEQIRTALAELLPDVQPAGTSDLTLAGRKCSGNSQQRKRHHLLHHGTILYAFDCEGVGRYLKMPSRQPDYRAGRAHDKFLVNLRMDAQTLKQRLRSVWRAETIREALPECSVRQLVAQKYGQPSWIERR
jgi:lipoate-protein ligase A